MKALLNGNEDPSEVQELKDAAESALKPPFFLDDNVDPSVENGSEAIKHPAGFYYSVY
jgi:hypothetical protein